MLREYRHISEYETEIISMHSQVMTLREIAEKLGFMHSQVQEFKTRYNKKQRMIEAGKSIPKKGRPCKSDNGIPSSIQKVDKLVQMRYVMASKDRYIKRLEMENELMRDFLSLTEVKPSIKYQVIFKHEGKYSINSTCKFFGVSRSGYYAFLKRMNIPDRDLLLAEKIRECQEESHRTYGYRRVHIWLEGQEIYRNPKRGQIYLLLLFTLLCFSCIFI